MNRRLHNKKGISLVEIVTVIAILGVSIGLFYTVFVINWKAFEQFIAQANLSQDMNAIVEKISADGRFAKDIQYLDNGTIKQVTFTYPDTTPPTTYRVTSSGSFVVFKNGKTTILSNLVDFSKTAFARRDSNGNIIGNNRFMSMDITMTDNVLGLVLTLRSITDIYTRNL